MTGPTMKQPTQMSAAQAAQQQQMQQIYLQQAQALHAQNQALQTASYFGTTPTGTGLNTALAGWVTNSTVTTPTTTVTTIPTWVGVVQAGQLCPDTEQRLLRDIVITDGREHHIFLPDGTTILIGKDGSFTINDKDAKITYRANRVRDFNSFVNASDKLEAFIKYCGEQGVLQAEMLDIPIKLFIGWLILQAAMADGENPEPDNLLEDLRDRIKPRCRCGRFLKRKHIERKIAFCRPVCLERELEAA